jgi:hypothetical protein
VQQLHGPALVALVAALRLLQPPARRRHQLLRPARLAPKHRHPAHRARRVLTTKLELRDPICLRYVCACCTSCHEQPCCPNSRIPTSGSEQQHTGSGHCNLMRRQAHVRSGMTALVRVTMPLTEMRQLMSAGFRSRITLLSCRLNVFTCTGAHSHYECLCQQCVRLLQLHCKLITPQHCRLARSTSGSREAGRASRVQEPKQLLQGCQPGSMSAMSCAPHCSAAPGCGGPPRRRPARPPGCGPPCP